jgi:tol-pal system protein YbgF
MSSQSSLFYVQRSWVAAAFLLSALVGNACAGLFDDEEARRAILDLRQSNADLRQQITAETQRSTEEGVQLRQSLIDLQNQLEGVRGEVAKLRGQGEQMVRELADVQRSQKDAAQSTDERLRKLEPIRISLDGRDLLVEPSEKRDYESALAIFRKSEFANAQLVFVDFLNRYPQTGYRPSVLFWLGNAQYATKDYKEAMANFRSLIAIVPDHARVPEAALAIANCQLEMKDNKAARKTLEDLVAKYPSSEAAAAARDRLARFK